MIPSRVIKFCELISIDKGLDLQNSGLTNVFSQGDVHTVKIKNGIKFYLIIVGSSITYRIDKENLNVHDFYRNYVGSLDKLSNDYKKSIAGYKIHRGLEVNFKPRVVISGKSPVAMKGYVGKVFTYSWGYDQTNNEFVKVISETAKQVKVVKLKTSQNYDSQSMTGSEMPINEFKSESFILTKDVYDGKISLRGTDKEGGSSGYSHIWQLWNKKPVGFSSYA